MTKKTPDIESLWRERMRALLTERGVAEDEIEGIIDHLWADSTRIGRELRERGTE